MWFLFVVIYIILSIVFTQFYKIATKKSKNDGALTILLQFIASICALILLPFFKFAIASDWKIYLLLIISCIFYAISDRINTTVRNGIEASTFSIINQLSTVFMILAGLLFFKEPFVLKKIIGSSLIIFSNFFIFYKKGEHKLNKYVFLGILSNIALSIALFLDVNISDNFNLAIYAMLTSLLPAILTSTFEKIKLSDLKNEYITGNKKAIIITSLCWGTMIAVQLRAYQLGNVTTVAPLCSLNVIGNVIVGYVFLKERNNLLKKIFAALLIIISVFLING